MTGEAAVDERATTGDLEPGQQLHAQTTETVEASLRALLIGADDGTPQTGDEPQPDATGNGETAAGSTTQDAEHEDAAARNEWPESALRRVDRLTAQKSELREKSERTNCRAEGLEADQISAVPSGLVHRLRLTQR